LTRADWTDDPSHVVLLDSANTPIGTAPKEEVHHQGTPRHRAFSCYLFDRTAPDRLLLTRRAMSKRSWPGVWTNSCCGHPTLGETTTEAARRRVHDELGIDAAELRIVLDDFSYSATDPSGIVENEFCPVVVGLVDSTPRPHPSEAMDWTWISWSTVRDTAACAPQLISPWAALQIPLLGARSPVLARPGEQV